MRGEVVTTLTDSERTRCEIWTRVMGYHRPVTAFNPGKQSEHQERRYFREASYSSPAHCQDEKGDILGSEDRRA